MVLHIFTHVPETPAAPVPEKNPAPEPAAEPNVPVLILKDSYYNDKGEKTAFEVRSDAIHIMSSKGQNRTITFPSTGVALADIDEEIRLQIARKISLLVPDLSAFKKEQLLKHVFDVLYIMAEDQVPRVRQMIAEELRSQANAPYDLVRKLAWDEELEVAAPVLEFSPLLSDSDLIEIISHSSIPGVLEAISSRQTVSETVSEAIVDNVTRTKLSDRGAKVIQTLLDNEGAEINENTLDTIIEHAPDYEMLQRSLIQRPELTTKTLNKIARFVSEAFILEMEEQGLLNREQSHNLTQAVASRLHSPTMDREKEAEREVIELFTQGELSPHFIAQALESGERDTVIASLSLLSDIPKSEVKRILESDNPRLVTALAWRCGLPMREAIQIQLKIAKIHFSKILYAREGTDYPLSEKEMAYMLNFFLGNG